MKFYRILILLLLSAFSLTGQNDKMKTKELRHAVFFKFKDTASAEAIHMVETAFRKLPAAIKEIKSLEWGLNNSPEKLNQGFTHCFFLTFLSEKDRDIYLIHPDHKAFGKVLGPYLDKVFVFDYWANK